MRNELTGDSATVTSSWALLRANFPPGEKYCASITNVSPGLRRDVFSVALPRGLGCATPRPSRIGETTENLTPPVLTGRRIPGAWTLAVRVTDGRRAVTKVAAWSEVVVRN